MSKPLSDLDNILSKIHVTSNCIITGDFNVDLFIISPSCQTILGYFSAKGFFQAISGISTNYGSQLDCAFNNNSFHSCHLYESYFSDHKPILITFEVGSNVKLADIPLLVLESPPSNIINNCISIVDYNNVTGEDNIDTSVIVGQVNIPPPIISHINVVGNNLHTFTNAMRIAKSLS